MTAKNKAPAKTEAKKEQPAKAKPAKAKPAKAWKNPYAELLSGQSKLASALREGKINPMQLLSASKELEALRLEDRAIKRAKRAAAGKDDEAAKAARAKKPRSGRPITDRLIRAALKGDKITGPAKNRILRAVNKIRSAKKLAAVELSALF